MEDFYHLEKLGLAEITVMDGVGAEKFAEHAWKYANDLVQRQTGGRVSCESCECSEHGANSAIYTPWHVRKERFADET
jgi:6-pyruvoyltetrahydropterin/6-carboxytetrahydropterin synthase